MNQAGHVAGGLNDSGLNLNGGSTSIYHVSTYVNLFFMTFLLDAAFFIWHSFARHYVRTSMVP